MTKEKAMELLYHAIVGQSRALHDAWDFIATTLTVLEEERNALKTRLEKIEDGRPDSYD